MKTVYILVLLAATVAAATALPPLGSVLERLGLGKRQETAFVDYADADYLDDDTNSTYVTDTDYTDDTNSTYVTDTDYTDDTNSTDVTDTDETDDTDDTDTTTISTTTAAPSSNDLSGGAIAGIVIGSVAGVALIAGGIYFMKKKEMLCFG